MAEQRTVTPHQPVWTLGDRLAKARRDSGLKQEDMAREFDVDPSAISQWENDKSRPRDVLAVTARWAEMTGVPLEWLRSRCLSGLPAPVGSTQLSFPEPPTLEIANSA